MKIGGGGRVSIGDNFHSGRECLIIAQNHTIEGRLVIYDEKYILKH